MQKAPEQWRLTLFPVDQRSSVEPGLNRSFGNTRRRRAAERQIEDVLQDLFQSFPEFFLPEIGQRASSAIAGAAVDVEVHYSKFTQTRDSAFSEAVIKEIIELRRLGFRFVALADNNFYPVTLRDLQLASRQEDTQRLEELKGIRAERFELMARLAQLPPDMVFFTQITMEAAEDFAFLDAMQQANIKGALVGVESVTPERLKGIYKEFTVRR